MSKFVLLALIRLPASENRRSLDTEVAGIARYLQANLASFGKFCERTLHQPKGFSVSSADGNEK